MALVAVEYSDEDQKIADAFQNMEPKNGDYWSDDSLASIKLRIKKHYLAAQGLTCCYCRRVVPITHSRAWDTEHIVPRKSHASFMFTPQNLAAACPDCNGKKGETQTLVDASLTSYPTTGGDFFIVHPHFDNYGDHITKGEFTYASRSEKGLWTIETCALTRFVELKIGWPEPVTDTRFEEQIDRAQSGDVSGAADISVQLKSAISTEHTGKPGPQLLPD